MPVEVVAVHGHIHHPSENLHAAELPNERRKPARNFHPARRNPDERDLREVGIALNDLVRDAPEGAFDGRGVEDDAGPGGWWSWVWVHVPWRPRGIVLKERRS